MSKPDDPIRAELSSVLSSLMSGFDRELREKTRDQLEEYWFFKWDEGAPVEINLYKFFDRRWEEMHHGSCCVVERVRDQYLMLKIRILVTELQGRLG